MTSHCKHPRELTTKMELSAILNVAHMEFGKKDGLPFWGFKAW